MARHAPPGPIRRVGTVGSLALRRLRANPTPHLAVGVVVFLASLSLTAAPRLLAEMSEEAIARRVAEAPVTERNMTIGRAGRIRSGVPGDEFSGVAAAGRSFREGSLPDSLGELIVGETFVVDAPRFVVQPWPDEEPPNFSTFVEFRYQQDIADHITLVTGRLPAIRDPVDIMFEEDTVSLPLIELAVATATRDALGLEHADRILLRPDFDDPRFTGTPSGAVSGLVVEVVGIFRPTEPNDDYWHRDDSLYRPREIFTADFDPLFTFTSGLIGPAAYRQLLSHMPDAAWTYRWRYEVDSALVGAANAEQLGEDLRSVEISYEPLSVVPSTELGFSTGLTDLIAAYIERRSATVSVMSLTAAGLVAVTLAVATMLAALAAQAMGGESRLLGGRGASLGQLTLSGGIEGIVLTVPAALLGYLAAGLMVPLP